MRLLTLTGAGGTGKTRLALEIARRLADGFADGACFVPLAAVGDGELVAPAIAQALGVHPSPGQPIDDALKAYVRERELLLVLDNFEHLLEAAPLVTELLAAAPGLTILATSRTHLNLYGESEYAVPPLGLARRGGLAVRRAGTGGAGRLRAGRRRRCDRGDLRAARRAAARDRARGGADPDAHARGDRSRASSGGWSC